MTIIIKYKKYELMLTRCTKAYSSSCFVGVHLGVCAAAEDRKNQLKPLNLEVEGLSKSSMLIRLKSLSLVLVVIGSMPMPICNCFYERLANNSKIKPFMEYRYLMPSYTGSLKAQKLRLGPSKSTFNAEHFMRSLSMSISIDFGAICSWNVSCSPKLPKNP